MIMDDLIMINYYKLAYYNFVKQSKAKQSKARIVYLINNLNFYILQFFKAFNFLSVRFRFAKNQFAILITRWLQPLVLTIHKKASQCNCTQWVKTHCYSGYAFSYALKNNFAILNLVKSFLTSITFDSLSRKIKNPCLVINKKYFKIMPMAKEKK